MSRIASTPVRALAVLGMAVSAMASGPAAGQHQPQASMPQHGMPGHTEAAPGPAGAAYQAALERMHGDMAADLTGDSDVDFARGMIPHHQGAIDMARALLEHGQDPELKALAEGIIAAQEQEITFLRAWLAKHDRAG